MEKSLKELHEIIKENKLTEEKEEKEREEKEKEEKEKEEKEKEKEKEEKEKIKEEKEKEKEEKNKEVESVPEPKEEKTEEEKKDEIFEAKNEEKKEENSPMDIEIPVKEETGKNSIEVEDTKETESPAAPKKDTKKKAPAKKVVKKNVWKPIELNTLKKLKSISLENILTNFSSLLEKKVEEEEEFICTEDYEENEELEKEENEKLESEFKEYKLDLYLGNYPSFLNILDITFHQYQNFSQVLRKNLKDFDDTLGFFLVHLEEVATRAFSETNYWMRPFDKCVWIQKVSKENKNRNILLPALILYSSSEQFKMNSLVNHTNLKRFPEKTLSELIKVRPRVSGSLIPNDESLSYLFSSPFISSSHKQLLSSFASPPNYMIVEYLRTRDLVWIKEDYVHEVYPSTNFPYDKALRNSAKKEGNEVATPASSLPNEKILIELNLISKFLEKSSTYLYDYSVINNEEDLDYAFQLQTEDNQYLVKEIEDMKKLSSKLTVPAQKKSKKSSSTNTLDSPQPANQSNSMSASNLKKSILMKIKKNQNEIIDSTGKSLTSRTTPSKLIPKDYFILLNKVNYKSMIMKNKFLSSKIPLPNKVYYENLPYGIISKNGLNLRRNALVRTRAFVNWLHTKKPMVFHDSSFASSASAASSTSSEFYNDEDEEILFLNSNSYSSFSGAGEEKNEFINLNSGKNNRIVLNFNNRKFENRLDYNNYNVSTLPPISSSSSIHTSPLHPTSSSDQSDLSDLKLLDTGTNVLKSCSSFGIFSTRTFHSNLLSNYFSSSSLISPAMKKNSPPSLSSSASFLLMRESLNPFVRKKMLTYELNSIQDKIRKLEKSDEEEEVEFFPDYSSIKDKEREKEILNESFKETPSSKSKSKKRNASSSSSSSENTNKIQKVES